MPGWRKRMIETADGLHERHRQQAGLIYYEAFRRKLQPLVGKPVETTQVLAAGLNLGMTLGALVDGELRGLAGLHHGGGIFSHVYRRDALARLGPVRGVYAWAALNLFAAGDHCPAGELRIAALAVDAAARPGAGFAPAGSGFRESPPRRLPAVRLEVVDTNPRARQLYERLGFRAISAHHYPFIGAWLGFSGDQVMVREL